MGENILKKYSKWKPHITSNPGLMLIMWAVAKNANFISLVSNESLFFVLFFHRRQVVLELRLWNIEFKCTCITKIWFSSIFVAEVHAHVVTDLRTSVIDKLIKITAETEDLIALHWLKSF